MIILYDKCIVWVENISDDDTITLSLNRKKFGVVILKEHTLIEMISEEKIRERVKELGREISADYKGESVLAVGVLKGSVIFYG